MSKILGVALPEPHTDERGYVLIPHPVGTTGLRCPAGCCPLTDGVRHFPGCPKVIAWREALSNVRGES